MRIVDKLTADRRLSWNRRGGVVLTALLGRIGRELTFARLVELTRLSVEDVRKQVVRFTTMKVLSRRTDLSACPAVDYFELAEASVVRARSLLQLVDDADLRDLVEERGLDIDAAYGRFLERQPYPVALGKALRDVRTDLGWSLVDVEAIAPLSIASLSNYERGVTLPTLIMVAELALRYGVDAVELIVYATCHSKTDPRVQRLRIADPTMRAVLTHQFAGHDQRELAPPKACRTQRTITKAG
jgi:transcriptional regulator with XRE-family HTH domain